MDSNDYSEPSPWGEGFESIPQENFKDYFYLSQCPKCDQFHFRNILNVVDHKWWNREDDLDGKIHHLFCRCYSCNHIWYRMHSRAVATTWIPDYPDYRYGFASSEEKVTVKDEFFPPKISAKSNDENDEQSRHLAQQVFEYSRLITQQNQQPKQIIVQGNLIELQGNVQINRIYLTEAAKAIDGIKKLVEQEPVSTFKNKSKEKILGILDDTAKDIAKESLKDIGKKICDIFKTDLVPLLPKITPYLATLAKLHGF